jgi:hypothetical protein
MWKKVPGPAVSFASVSGMVTNGASAASRSATDLIGAKPQRLDFETRPMFRPGFFFSPRVFLAAEVVQK